MKKIMIICLGMIMSLGMMAQDNKCKADSQRVRLSAEQKAQILSDRMAKAYDLSAEQKAQLYELNLKALKKNRFGQGRFAQERRGAMKPGCPMGQKQCDKQDCDKKNCDKKPECSMGQKPECDKAQCPKDSAKCDKMRRPGMRGQHERFSYNAELTKILSPEQFAAYKMDKSIERSISGQRAGRMMRGARGMKRGGFGMRGPGRGRFNGPRADMHFGGQRGFGQHGHGNMKPQCDKQGAEAQCGAQGQKPEQCKGQECKGDKPECKGENKDCKKAAPKEPKQKGKKAEKK